ncbi:MAG: methyltransferase [Bradyrhizobiaceae bacterium]|nr:methyltransferase [Bradyrhizobiaceae bacterium]
MTAKNPSAELMQLANAFRISRAVHVVAELGIGDLLKDGPRKAEELAAETNTHPRALYRVLRTLAAVGVFHEGNDRNFSLTEVGQCLRSDAQNPVYDWAKFVGRPYAWQTWAELLQSVRTGESVFRHVHGCEAFEYRARHPEENLLYDRAQAEISRGVSEAVAKSYDFSAFKQIIDVGGGQGGLLIRVLQVWDRLRGVLFDQPQVVANAGKALAAAGVLDRCEIVGGSFFDSIPAGSDGYMMKAILHNWDDEPSISILRNIRKAMRPDGKLLIVERVVGGPNEDLEAKLSDLQMMVALGGLERTLEEFTELFDASGFRIERVIPTGTRYSIIECLPV